MRDGMRIGEAARQAGVKVQTLRYYERRGLIPGPARTPSNYRVYTPDDVRRVRFIKRAQGLGFTLEEIKDLLALRIEPGATCGDVRGLAEEKIAGIRDKIGALRSMQAALERLVAACSGEGSVGDCPILESLEREGGAPQTPSRTATSS